MNLWVFIFFISLVIFAVLTDWRKISVNIWGGVIAAALQLVQNLVAHSLNFWKHYKVAEELPNTLIFSNWLNIFIVGVAFTMGTLFLQFLPRNMILQLIHAGAWMFFFRLLHEIGRQFDLIYHISWSVWGGVQAIPTQFLLLAWFKNCFFTRKPVRGTANDGNV